MVIILHMCTINDNHMMYVSWDAKRDRQNFLSFLTIFSPFTHPPLTTQNFEKLKKKTSGDIILHKHTKNKNYDQMMYGSWDMARDRCNYFSFWAIFCTFTSLTAWKIKILQKWKEHLEILSIYICVPEVTKRWCLVSEIWCMTCVIIFHFGLFFAL